jgi:hypothetical protein
MVTRHTSSSTSSGLKASAASKPAGQQWRLPLRWRRPLLVIHLVATIGFLGTALAMLVLTIAGARGADPREIYPAAQMLTVWLTLPLAIVAIATGLLQAILSPWGLISYWWVALKLAITVVVTVVIVFLIYPRLAGAAGTAIGRSTQPLTDAQRSRIAFSPPIVCALLLVNVFMGIYKPRWRLKSRRSPAAVDTSSTSSSLIEER